MRVECWAIKTASGFVKDYCDPAEGFKTMTFLTRKAARKWLEEHPYFKGDTVKLIIFVQIKDY